ncbi:MAG: hypothetical protein MUQ64_05605, partial [Paracoccaceae bacterium]|nr:hypothetical protein [Paracoccaceae bacterium]
MKISQEVIKHVTFNNKKGEKMIKKIFKNALLGAIALIMSTTSVLAADMVIGVPNWPTANATANILKLAIEQNLGLDVELQSGTNPIFFEGMDQGSV